ncbi:hypothetical protein ACFLRF_01125 [Candidatus Altiarchaeota archaeon]
MSIKLLLFPILLVLFVHSASAVEYSCEYSWPQKVLDKASGAVVRVCDRTTPYCNKQAAGEGRIQCCKYDDGRGYYDCGLAESPTTTGKSGLLRKTTTTSGKHQYTTTLRHSYGMKTTTTVGPSGTTSTLKSDIKEDVGGCRDSDGGPNYFERGECTMSGSKIAMNDFCSGQGLYECTCQGGKISRVWYGCPAGCVKGRCNPTTTLQARGPVRGYMCYPSWPARIIDNVTYENLSACDASRPYCHKELTKAGKPTCCAQYHAYTNYSYDCADPVPLNDPSVSSTTSTTTTTTLPHNDYCTDNDGGINYAVKGTCIGTELDHETWYTIRDKCHETDLNRLYEYYCGEDDVVKTKIYYCPAGCSEGRCNTRCQDTDGGLNHGVVGKCMQEGLEDFPDYCQGKKILECECLDDTAHYMSHECLIDCVNSTCITCEDIDGGLNYEKKDQVNYVSAGKLYSEHDRCEAGILLEFYCGGGQARSKRIDCPIVCEDGACLPSTTTTITTTTTLPRRCIETDEGKDIYKKGSATSTNNMGLNQTFTDKCESSKKLLEYYCDKSNGRLENLQETCELSCVDGACVNPHCVDSDGGKNGYENGVVRGPRKDGTGIIILEDSCFDDDNVLEAICAKNTGNLPKESCESGCHADVLTVYCENGCKNGVCNPKGCTDDDGGQMTSIRAKARGPYPFDNHEYKEFEDVCISPTQLNEYYCHPIDATLTQKTYVCPNGCSNGICIQTARDCIDGDMGQDIMQKTSVLGYDAAANSVEYTDKCKDDDHVKEYYCKEHIVKEQIHQCQYGCDDGACLSPPPTTTTTSTTTSSTTTTTLKEKTPEPGIIERIIRWLNG